MIKKNFKTLATFSKKGLAIIAACTIALPAFAEGYQVNSQSARQEGMGHTGTALKLGAESMLFNPAGMAFMESKWDISLGVTGIASSVKFKQFNTQNEIKTDNPLSTPLFGYIGYKPCEKLAVGLSITNPAGNSIVYPDSWAGSTLIQEVSLKAFSLQPTVSYKFNDVVSIGAGLMIDFGSFSQKKALVAAGAFNQMGGLMSQFGPMLSMLPSDLSGALSGLANGISSLPADKDIAGIELSGNSKVSLGFNVGILVNISEKVSLGASYRSKVKMTVEEGEAELYYANEAAKSVISGLASAPVSTYEAALKPMLGDATYNTIIGTQAKMKSMQAMDGAAFEASLPIPSILNVGVSYKPTQMWTLAADFQYTGWSAYDALVVKFDETTGNYTLSSHKGYDNSFAVRIGAERIISDFATVRIGSYLDTTPVQDDNYNPETPGALTYCATAGASLTPVKFFTIDLAFAYITGKTMYSSCPSDSGDGVFGGKYKKSAIMPAIGLRFKF